MYLSSKEGNGGNSQNVVEHLKEAEIKQAQGLWFLTSAVPIHKLPFPQIKVYVA